MSGGVSARELGESVRLLRTELWLFVGGILSYVCYGVWVLATGTLVTGIVPSLDRMAVTTVAGVELSALTIFAILAWFVLPALITVSQVQRKLTNTHGNLASQYRLNHPSVLLAPSGLALLGCLAATVVFGQSPLLAAIAFVASIHLFVRTIAYGHRVYTLSYPRVFWLFVFLVALLLAFGWLVQAPLVVGMDDRLTDLSTTANVDVVTDTLSTMFGVTSSELFAYVIAIPALLSVLYVVPQMIAGLFVRRRAPLANPKKRAGQRYPIMPPRVQSTDAQASESVTATAVTPVHHQETDDVAASAESTETKDKSGTQVFVPDQPSPDPETLREENDHDGWVDDTDVFSAEQPTTAANDQCPACHTDLSDRETASFCPDCGQSLT